MTTRTWAGAATAGLLALGGCAAHPERRQATAENTTATAAQQAQQAAAKSDQDLAQARRRLEAAHQSAIQADQQRAQARQQLAQADQSAEQARQRISAEQAEVQRLEDVSREEHARAEQATMDAQVASEEAQGLRTTSGRIAEATPTRVVIATPDAGDIAFDIEPRTRVLVGTEPRSVADLQQGADARVAYDPSAAHPAAVVIHVAPARGPSAPRAQPRR